MLGIKRFQFVRKIRLLSRKYVPLIHKSNKILIKQSTSTNIDFDQRFKHDALPKLTWSRKFAARNNTWMETIFAQK